MDTWLVIAVVVYRESALPDGVIPLRTHTVKPIISECTDTTITTTSAETEVSLYRTIIATIASVTQAGLIASIVQNTSAMIATSTLSMAQV